MCCDVVAAGRMIHSFVNKSCKHPFCLVVFLSSLHTEGISSLRCVSVFFITFIMFLPFVFHAVFMFCFGERVLTTVNFSGWV